jgi:NAD(P)H-flavin reductase
MEDFSVMINKLNIKCIDLNSHYCPCSLSDTNHCIFCSHLKGEEVCDCDFSGICALYEKKWRPKRREPYYAHLDIAAPVRMEVETRFRIVKEICANTYEIEFGVSKELAQALLKTGSFVFLRKPDDQPFYFFPVGIMSLEENFVKVVIETVGAKSSRLFKDGNNSLFVRGPYYNGYFGQPWIDNIKNGKILIITGGMGQPPALPAALKLKNAGNEVASIIAPGKIGKVFIADELKEAGVKVEEVASMRKWGMNMFKEIITGDARLPDLIVSAGPDDQHYAVINVMNQCGVDIPMAATNNNIMCCGEGICGSCERKTKTGAKLRTCKAQIDFKHLEPMGLV